MTATVDKVGQQVTCHDCGTRHIVPKPSLPAKKIAVLATDAQTPQLDPDARPAERPFVMPTANRLSIAEERQEAEYAAAAQKSERTGRRMALDTRGRPVLPPYPLLTGVAEFPFTSGVPTRWIMLTLCLVLWGALMIDGLQGWIAWSGPKGGGEAVFAALAETFMAAPLALVWYASLSSIVIAIFSQSAVGARRVDDWPSLNFIHSMSEMLPLAIAITFCMAPGWGIVHVFADELWQELAAGGITLILGLPIVMLSQLAGNSTWELIDLKVLGAAVRCPFSMMLVLSGVGRVAGRVRGSHIRRRAEEYLSHSCHSAANRRLRHHLRAIARATRLATCRKDCGRRTRGRRQSLRGTEKLQSATIREAD